MSVKAAQTLDRMGVARALGVDSTAQLLRAWASGGSGTIVPDLASETRQRSSVKLMIAVWCLLGIMSGLAGVPLPVERSGIATAGRIVLLLAMSVCLTNMVALGFLQDHPERSRPLVNAGWTILFLGVAITMIMTIVVY